MLATLAAGAAFILFAAALGLHVLDHDDVVVSLTLGGLVALALAVIDHVREHVPAQR